MLLFTFSVVACTYVPKPIVTVSPLTARSMPAWMLDWIEYFSRVVK